LLSLEATPALAPKTEGNSCAGSDPGLVAERYADQRDAMQRLAQAMMAAEEGGEFKVLDGRGYGYFPERNPAVDLARLQREAAEQAAARAEQAN
jgi:hypothetical protein